MSHLFFFSGVPNPFAFLRLPWPLTLHFHELLLSSLGFSGPITLFLIIGAHGIAINPLLSCFHYFGPTINPLLSCFHYFGPTVTHSHFFTSYTAHGLLFFFFFLSFQAPLSPFTLSRPICLSYESVIHYFYHLGLMSFLSIYQIFSVCVVGLFLFTWTSKMAINNVID